jgi:hypothetical protein
MIEQALLRTLTFVFSAAVLCAGGCKDTSSPNSGVPGEAVSPGGGGGTVAADSPAEDHAEATTGERAVVPRPEDSTFVECTVRTEVCTREYMPVCGTLTDGSQRSYSNKCVACSDQAVRGYVTGACPDDQPPT